MWIYAPSEKEEPSSAIACTEAFIPPVPEGEAKEAVSSSEPAPVPAILRPTAQRRTTKLCTATRDCWLLAAAFLLGSIAAGVLQAVCDARQMAALGFYLERWRALFVGNDLQHAVKLFGSEYMALGIVVSLFLLLGLSALGPLLIFSCMMLYGLGSGLLLVQLSAAGGWKSVLLALLWTGIPAALASGCLCLFGSSALQVSSRIRAYSFWNRSSGQAGPNIRALLGQYLLTMVLLLPLCGAAAGLSCLGSRF